MRRRNTACSNCRNKKVKCEGKFPCKYCYKRDLECTTGVIRESAITKRNHTGTTHIIDIYKNGALEGRLARIESLMRLVLAKKSELQALDNKSSGKVAATVENDKNGCLSSGLFNSQSRRIRKLTPMPNNQLLSRSSPNSFFSIDGLMWITERVQDSEIVFPLNSLIPNFIKIEKQMLSAWTDPIDASKLSALPQREIIGVLIDSYAKVCVFNFSFVKEAKQLGGIYCDYRDGRGPLPKFKNGELLFLNACLLLGSLAYFELTKVGYYFQTIIPRETISTFKDIFLNNAIFYFHREKSLQLNNCLESVKGLILLSFFAGIFIFTDPLNSISSYIIKKAQALGLNKAEYYVTLTGEAKTDTLQIWWLSYFLEQMASLKTGKPPLTNTIDITAPPLPHLEKYSTVSDADHVSASLSRKSLRGPILTYIDCQLNRSTFGLNGIFSMMAIDLSTILAKIHKTLFTKALYSTEERLNTVTTLLNDLEDWRLCFPESIRPGCVSSKNIKVKMMNEELIRKVFIISYLNMNYYYLKLIMTMFAVRNSRGEAHARYTELGLDTARDLLHFVLAMARRFLPVAGFSLFYSFSAFLNVAAYCIQEPTNNDVENDIKLLVDSCNDYFSCFTESKSSPETWIMVGVVCRCILYVAATVVMKHNCDIHVNVNGLMNEIKELQRNLSNESTISQTIRRITVEECPASGSSKNSVYSSTDTQSETQSDVRPPTSVCTFDTSNSSSEDSPLDTEHPSLNELSTLNEFLDIYSVFQCNENLEL